MAEGRLGDLWKRPILGSQGKAQKLSKYQFVSMKYLLRIRVQWDSRISNDPAKENWNFMIIIPSFVKKMRSILYTVKQSKQAYSIKRHEETEKWNEMKDE